MNPTPGIDPVSPQSFTAEQIVDVGSAKSLDDFFVILLHALDSFFFFFFCGCGIASLNYIFVKQNTKRFGWSSLP